MGALELTITIGYLLAMGIYGHICYVQGVMDRDESVQAPSVQRALRLGRRFVDPRRTRDRRPRPTFHHVGR